MNLIEIRKHLSDGLFREDKGELCMDVEKGY